MTFALRLGLAVFVALFTGAELQNCQPASIRGTGVTDLTSTNRTVFESNGNISLHVTVTWNLTNENGVDLDGSLILIQDVNGVALRGICDVGTTSFWVKANDSFCSALPSPSCTGDMATGSDVCMCDLDLCPDRAALCIRGSSIATQLGMGYFSIRPGKNSVTFVGEFLDVYAITIRPYAGTHSNVRLSFIDIGATPECSEKLVDEGFNVSYAAKLCCDIGKNPVKPRNLTIIDMIPDFLNRSVTVTVTWIDPVAERDFNSTAVASLVPADASLSHSVAGTPSVTFPLPSSDPFVTSCDQPVAHRSTLVGLRIGATYILDIHIDPNINCVLGPGACRDQLLFSTDLDLCSFGFCDVNANCSNGINNFDANCTCRVGYEGDGKFNASGGGCGDKNFCDQDTNPCAIQAECTDRVAPLTGAECQCRQGYYGDGIANQGGCNSLTNLLLAILIPLVAVVLFVIAVVAWKIRERRIREKVLTWEQFVANKSLMAKKEFVTDDIGEESCLPMFGEQWEIDRSSLELGDVIGRGNYGIVYKAFVKSDCETEYVAAKTIQEGQQQEDRLRDFLHEIGFMMNVGKHPHVISVLGCCTTQKPVLLVTEFLKYGDLKDFLHSVREPQKYKSDPAYHVTLKELTEMAHQVAMGMEFLTKNRVIHGDLAARNILVGENRVCKIADFGLANDVYRYGLLKSRAEKTVPFKWISPERMKQGQFPITTKSDVWSFGNLLYEMVTLGCTPHSDVPHEQLFDKLKAGYRMKQPESCGDEMYAIMSKCWRWKIWARPSFAQLVKILNSAVSRTDYVAVLPNGVEDHYYENFVDINDEPDNTRL